MNKKNFCLLSILSICLVPENYSGKKIGERTKASITHKICRSARADRNSSILPCPRPRQLVQQVFWRECLVARPCRIGRGLANGFIRAGASLLDGNLNSCLLPFAFCFFAYIFSFLCACPVKSEVISPGFSLSSANSALRFVFFVIFRVFRG